MITIVIFLGILSIILIYSLMVSDVEEKTYTYGMLRALGFKNNSLKGLITLQAFSFSIPGLISGMIVASFLNVAIRFFIY
jgi:ABC-type antimicrobial peptide transport system permease subunit